MINLEDIVKTLNKEDLIVETERLVRVEGMQYVEAVVHLCETRGIDPEDISHIIIGSLKEKLRAEAQRNHILPKPPSLFDV